MSAFRAARSRSAHTCSQFNPGEYKKLRGGTIGCSNSTQRNGGSAAGRTWTRRQALSVSSVPSVLKSFAPDAQKPLTTERTEVTEKDGMNKLEVARRLAQRDLIRFRQARAFASRTARHRHSKRPEARHGAGRSSRRPGCEPENQIAPGEYQRSSTSIRFQGGARAR